MPKKRKYARIGEASTKDECTNRKCKWQGTDNEKFEMRINDVTSQLVCPKCGNNEFYPLLSELTPPV